MSQTPSETRLRVLRAAARCIERWSVSKVTMADVAREAGVSRATLYRVLPDGRDELLEALVQYEMAEFFGELARSLDNSEDLASLLTEGLMYAHRMLNDHALYQRVMATEPELILPLLTVESSRVRQLIVEYLRPWVVASGVAHVEVDALLDYLSRMVLSFIEAPGSWDMDDRAMVGRLVESRFLAPIRAAAAH